MSYVSCSQSSRPVVVGFKNFTESRILATLISVHLNRSGIPVDTAIQACGGSIGCRDALIRGSVDVYVEYTGTAYSEIVGLAREWDSQTVLATVDSIYRERWDLAWGVPLGFSNTFVILIREAMQRDLGITTLSEAADHVSQWRAGFGSEFTRRIDGLDSLSDRYDMTFHGAPTIMDFGLLYRALADSTVDVIAGNSTDPMIAEFALYPLKDDLQFFPPYEAVPVVGTAALERHPGLQEALSELGGKVTERDMMQLNRLVEVESKELRSVAGAFIGGTGQ